MTKQSYINILMLLALAMGLTVLLLANKTPKIPECNPYWPQSYSEIPAGLQPCPTPVPINE